MSIPSNITKEHLLKAINIIDKDGIPPHGDSQFYDVLYNGRTYPPKLIVSYANIEANGYELKRGSFRGGRDTECFNLLEQNGFKIIEKGEDINSVKKRDLESFGNTIISFISQALTDDLKTSSYPKVYKNLGIRVSFGQGNPARVPWISFLRKGQAVSNGIYPVFLYYKEQQLLIIAYGLSETQDSRDSWNLSSPKQTIKDFFATNFETKPSRYGDSFVHSYYFIDAEASNFGLNTKEVDRDLDVVIEIYNKLPLDQSDHVRENQLTSNRDNIKKQSKFDFKNFCSNSKDAGLIFSERLVVRFISSLCTKPFVILTGLAGSGKTKLAQAFSKWISADANQVCLVPIGADWTNREPLLGFPNALDSTKYSSPENGALQLLINANQNPDKPYFLILDEMNLSHVERYFADFLSAMESHEPIPLHAEEDIQDIPQSILIPKNLFIIGTVNIDETTYMFSPKVLDRANAIEFRVTHDEMGAYLGNPSKLNLSMLTAKGADMAADFVSKAKAEGNGYRDSETLNTALLSFFKELKKVGAEFGYRTATEIKRFAEVVHTLDDNWSTSAIVDAAIMQKLLPKLHGSRRKIEPTLKALASLCLVQQVDVVKVLCNIEEVDLDNAARIKYPISLEKISRMYKAVVQDGFTSFAEA